MPPVWRELGRIRTRGEGCDSCVDPELQGRVAVGGSQWHPVPPSGSAFMDACMSSLESRKCVTCCAVQHTCAGLLSPSDSPFRLCMVMRWGESHPSDGLRREIGAILITVNGSSVIGMQLQMGSPDAGT